MYVNPSHTSIISNPKSVSASPVKVAPAPTAPSLLDDPATARMLRTLDPALAAQGVPEAVKQASGDPSMHPQMQALIDAWGTSDPDFDLDSDGVVGMSDLLIMMEKLAGQPAPAEEGIEEEETPSPEAPYTGGTAQDEPSSGEAPTVDGLLKAWGSSNNQFDINGSGNVNMADLFQLLAKMSAAQGDASPVPGTGGQADGGAAGAIPPAQSMIELLRTWNDANTSGTGAAGSGNGSMASLFEMLNQMSEASGGPAPLGAPLPGASAPSLADRATNKLLTNFREQGFTSAPPLNVGEIVNGLGFGADMTRSVMSKLAEAYPQGLGVKMLA